MYRKTTHQNNRKFRWRKLCTTTILLPEVFFQFVPLKNRTSTTNLFL